MLHKFCTPGNLQLVICFLLALLTACAPATPVPTHTPIPVPTSTLTPSPTPTPTLTPTATPIPPLELSIHWPEQVSALQPVAVEVELVPPPGVSVTATVHATVTGPGGRPRWLIDLMPREGNRYASEELVQFPLESLEGNWRVVVYVQSTLPVAGDRGLIFQPAPIYFHDLANVLPAGVDLRVPQDFVGAMAQGDQWAGRHVWRYGGSEIALWWAPGPTEPLLLNNAVVMLEATYDPDEPPHVLDVEETERQGQTAFLFHEDWPGVNGDLSEALVIQGPDYWLYVLRVRTTDGGAIPPLLRQVRDTFAFVEEHEE